MADNETMRHHVTIETPRTAGGSWGISCTCGHRETITKTTVQASGLTAGEYVQMRRRIHRAGGLG